MTVRTFILCLALAPFGACIANPTPHPVGGDDTVQSFDSIENGADATPDMAADVNPSPPDNRSDCQAEGGYWNDGDGLCELSGYTDVDEADVAMDTAADAGPEMDADASGDAWPDVDDDAWDQDPDGHPAD